MVDKNQTGTESLEAAEVTPQHESWIAITTSSTIVGAAILICLIVLLVIVIDLHFNRASLVFLVSFINLVVFVFVLRSTPMSRHGVLGNVELSMRLNLELRMELPF